MVYGGQREVDVDSVLVRLFRQIEGAAEETQRLFGWTNARFACRIGRCRQSPGNRHASSVPHLLAVRSLASGQSLSVPVSMMVTVALFGVICLASSIDAQLFMPFSHLGHVLKALKHGEEPQATADVDSPAFDYMNFANLPWLRNLTSTTGGSIVKPNPPTTIRQKPAEAPAPEDRWTGGPVPRPPPKPDQRLPLTPPDTRPDARPDTRPDTRVPLTRPDAPDIAGRGRSRPFDFNTAPPLPPRTRPTIYNTITPMFTNEPVEYTTNRPETTSTVMQTTTGEFETTPKIVPYKPLKPASCEACKPGRPCEITLRSFETSDQIFQYAYSHSTPAEEAILQIMRKTQGSTLPPPLSWKSTTAPEVVQLSMNLMKLYKPNRSLVVGVFTGVALYGVASMTDVRGLVVALEYPEFADYWKEVGMEFALKSNIMSRIQYRAVEDVDKALMRLSTNEPNAFDFVLLDDHRQVNYLDDYELCIRLLRSGGLLVITDALNGGSVLSGPDFITQEGKAVQNMNLRIKNDSRVVATFLPFGGGIWLIVKK